MGLTTSKHVKGVEAAATAAILQTLLTELVVELALLGVAEDLISDCDIFELFGITALVGVLLNSYLTERLFDFILSSVLRHIQ